MAYQKLRNGKEANAYWRTICKCLFLRQATVVFDGKHNDGITVLIGGQQIVAGWIDGKVARCTPAAGDAFHELRLSRWQNAENGDAIVPTIRRVQKRTVGGQMKVGTDAFLYTPVGKRGDLVRKMQHAVGIGEMHHTRRQLISKVEMAAIRVEHANTRTAAGRNCD